MESNMQALDGAKDDFERSLKFRYSLLEFHDACVCLWEDDPKRGSWPHDKLCVPGCPHYGDFSAATNDAS